MLYGAETWALTKGQEARIETNEMMMTRMSEVTCQRKDNQRPGGKLSIKET